MHIWDYVHEDNNVVYCVYIYTHLFIENYLSIYRDGMCGIYIYTCLNIYIYIKESVYYICRIYMHIYICIYNVVYVGMPHP